MFIGLKKDYFDYYKSSVRHGKVRKDKLFGFLKLKEGEVEYRPTRGINAADATFEPSEIKEVLNLSSGITILDVTPAKWKKFSYNFPEDLAGYVSIDDTIKTANKVDRLLLEGLNIL